jgi:NADP-dependent 3-hydroxy acid dehydrogenase YdfG
MVSTNILGNAMATRMAVQDMRRRNTWGHIINMVGLSGHRIPDAPAGGTFFAATKFAVRAITEGLRQEARANKVRCVVLCCWVLALARGRTVRYAGGMLAAN